MNDINRLRYVTSSFTRLQGLRLVPFGLALLLVALLQPPPVPFGDRTATDVTVPLLTWIAAFIAWWAIGRWYSRTYGEVRPHFRVTSWLAPVVWLTCFIAADWLMLRLDPSVDLRGLVVAAGFAGIATGAPRHRAWYYTAAASIVGAVSLLPAFGLLTTSQVLGMNGATIGRPLVAILLIVCGLLDHSILARSLPPVVQEEA